MTQEEFEDRKRQLELQLLEERAKAEIAKLQAPEERHEGVKNGWGTAALIFACIFPILGLILGIVALAINDPKRHTNRASGGFAIGIALTWFLAAVVTVGVESGWPLFFGLLAVVLWAASAATTKTPLYKNGNPPPGV